MSDPAPAPHRPRVLTVGAYERDNFGDLLFLLVTERYLPDADIVVAAPFAADMTALLDRPVAAVGDVLRDEDVDAIWAVGGQTGGVAMEAAFRMSMPPEVTAEFRRASPARQREMLSAAGGGEPQVSPYLPNPAAFPRNAGATSIINSSAIAGIGSLSPHVRDELVGALRGADAISVRNVESSAWLERLGIVHTLVPDVVHALGAIEPFSYDPGADNVVVQASNAILRGIGHEALAQHLVASTHLADLRIRLLAAGTAAGHDSIDQLARVADEIRRLAPSREVEVITDRRPMDLVRHLREARVTIGSSLHVRIVSAAYDVPRLTFTRPKASVYAATWDAEMPYDVELADLDRHVGRALELGARDETIAASRNLSRLAEDNIRTLADLVMTQARTLAPADRTARGRARISAYEPLRDERLACAPLELRLRGELDDVRNDLRAVRAELKAARRELDEERTSDVPLRTRARRVAGRVKRRVLGQNSSS